jgi:hypothetical protein
MMADSLAIFARARGRGRAVTGELGPCLQRLPIGGLQPLAREAMRDLKSGSWAIEGSRRRTTAALRPIGL